MVKFYILNGTNKRECTATDPAKAAQILALMFLSSKGYVVQDNKIVFAQNMSVADAESLAGIKPVEVIVAPKSTDVKPTKPAKKPVKAKPKKAKVKSKVVVKAKKPVKKAKPAKKAKVKSKVVVKVKPKTKAKVKVNKKNGKVKSNGKHR